MKIGLMLTKVFVLIFLTSCGAVDDTKFTINGHVENAGGVSNIVLYEGEKELGAAALDENQDFYFEGNAPEPGLYTLLVGERPYMLVLENGETVKFQADMKKPADYKVSGSKTSAKLKELDAVRETFQKQQTALGQEFEQRMNNGEEAAVVQSDLMTKSENFIADLSEQVVEFSLDNKDNLAGFYGMLILYTVDPTGQEEALVNYAEEVKDQFPNNDAVQSFVAHMAAIKPLSIGQVAPDFASLTPEGDEVKLSDLRGQYVLLDFWAAWCGPCRQENPNIVEQFHRFKDKGFTVLGVSLDRDRDAWLKAIKDDKLEWTQISDLKMWDSEAGQLYNISAIPASFMIDPDGKIVGKNLRGPALRQFLEENL
ncbi:TlpA disulfide reductase family protein [Albibacterium indicum]|uniref:TlpA disulfide reductase family protein n=1 Tax=Albibacterium indicum TaxID=2292082 RepID=UPI000E4A3318|nr:TlpA disulfide reductase family protein [Pedobacter indicus]